MNTIIPSEWQRARTNLIEIAKDLLPDGTTWRDEPGHERRAEHAGGLLINTRKATWYFYSTEKGGRSPVGLINQLRQYPIKECVVWLTGWLQKNRGTGACTVGAAGDDNDGAEDGAAASAYSVARAQWIQKHIQAVPGTTIEIYLNSRGIFAPYPPCVFHLEDARFNGGECAIVGVLEAHGRVTGYQVGYLTPSGTKSLIQPQRERFDLEKQKGAVFRMPASPEALAGPRDPIADYLLGEGLEDAASLAQLDRPCMVLGLPGIGALAHLDLPQKSRVVVFKDGDEVGSAAALGCDHGIDHLINTGMKVLAVKTPTGLDANAILTDPEKGSEHLREMLRRENLSEPTLSFDGRVARLAKLEKVAFAQERAAIAKIFKVSVKLIDEELKQYRPPPVADPSTEEGPGLPDDPPWLGEIPQLGPLLEEALAQVTRYIVAGEPQLASLVVWAAHTHTIYQPQLEVYKSPRFAVQSPERGSGKTTTLRALANLCPRPDKSSSYTAATVWRSIAADHPTLFLDEANTILKDDTKADLVAVLNCGDLRDDAWIKRSVPTPKGGWRVERVNVFGAVAFAGIKELTETLQDRSIIFPLKKVPGTKVPEHLRDGKAAELLLLRRKLAAWAAHLRELPNEPRMPGILLRQAGRVGDNWRPLFAIAELAGGRWPALIEQAALGELFGEVEPSVLDRLLLSIRKLFAEEKLTQAELKTTLESAGHPYEPESLPDNHLRLQTATIVERLIADGAEEWGRIHERREITPVWLGRQLRGLLNPPGAQDWWIGPRSDRKHYSGYWREQFQEVWEIHPFSTLPLEPGVPGEPGVRVEKPRETAEKCPPGRFDAPGDAPGSAGRSETPDDPNLPGVPKDKVIQDVASGTPGTPGTPGFPSRSPEEHSPEGGDPFAWVHEQPAEAGDPAKAASGVIRQHLKKPGSFVLVTMVEGSPRYSFEDGTSVTGQSGKALSADEFNRLDLAPVEGESLIKGGLAQRYVLRRQAETSSPTLAEKLAEKLGSVPKPPNGPAVAPTVDRGIRRPMKSDMIRDAILAHARAHPEWSAKDISKVVPRAASVIQRILDAELRDSKPEGTA